VARVLKSFHEQTYRNKRLLIYDTSEAPGFTKPEDGEVWIYAPGDRGRTIGDLRNRANAHTDDVPWTTDIIAHWDSDDWSHPNRLAEQVALLCSGERELIEIGTTFGGERRRHAGEWIGPDAVSYNEMLFWDSVAFYDGQIGGAWLYRSPNPLCPIGTSLMYWRSTWERQPFANRSQGEDLEWWSRVRGVMASSFVMRPDKRTAIPTHPAEPRTIAAIHGGNTVPNPINPDSREWKRVPEWDSYCRGVMA